MRIRPATDRARLHNAAQGRGQTRKMTATLAPYTLEDRPWVMSAHLSFYRARHSFDDQFAVAVASALDAVDAGLANPASCDLIAWLGDHRIGCISFGPDAPGIGRVRLFFVASGYRGQGLGRQLLNATLDHARRCGIGAIRVSTFESHPEACALYRSVGFHQSGRAPVHAFGQDLIQLDFERSARP